MNTPQTGQTKSIAPVIDHTTSGTGAQPGASPGIGHGDQSFEGEHHGGKTTGIGTGIEKK